jgi:hypothetical protein
MLEEMIDDRHYALTLEFFEDKFTELGFIQTTEARNQHVSIYLGLARVSKATAQNDNFQTEAWTYVLDRQFIEVGVSGTYPRADRTPCMRQLPPPTVSP